MRFFTLPDLGEGLQEAEIVEWAVTVGDDVAADQVLLTVETAKALVEIPSPQAGTIAHLFGKPGDIVHIGEPLLEFAGAQPETSTTVVGTVREADATAPTREHFIIGSPQRQQRARPDATPAIRALALRLGVDLAAVAPTGPGGVVTGHDVERAAQLDERLGKPEPLRGVRRAMAQNMERAQREVAQATVFDEVDVHRWPADTDITLRLILAIAAACRREPALNAWYDGSQRCRRLLKAVDLGIAVDTEDGLFVPVLRNVGQRDAGDVAAGLARLKADVRARTIPPEELRNPGITLSNYGTLCGRFGTPIVVPPTVAIIGAGTVYDAVVPWQGSPAIHPLLPLSLSFDHRCVTGAEAARFLSALGQALQQAAAVPPG